MKKIKIRREDILLCKKLTPRNNIFHVWQNNNLWKNYYTTKHHLPFKPLPSPKLFAVVKF